MPKITDIRQQQKRRDRYSVYVDGKYVCSFSEGELLRLGLHRGQRLNEEELARLKDESHQDKAYMKALDQLSRRPRSEWELRDYLKRKGYADESAGRVIERLSKLGYVDDGDFARRWVENRRLLKPVSKRRLRQELKQKRVGESIIESVLEEDAADERQVLKDLIERKRRQAKYQDDLKLKQYLSRQGFSYDDIRSVLDDRGE
jgi:regulatory protein